MTDQEIYLPPEVLRSIQETARALAVLQNVPPPKEVARLAAALRPTVAALMTIRQMAVSSSVAGIQLRQQAAYAEMVAAFAATHQVPVPTAEELAETDAALRTQVLPETSEEELAEAVTGIADDPEKVKLAAFLSEVIDQLTGIPGSAPWVKFVVVFWLAMKLNPDVVGALALAYALVQGLG